MNEKEIVLSRAEDPNLPIAKQLVFELFRSHCYRKNMVNNDPCKTEYFYNCRGLADNSIYRAAMDQLIKWGMIREEECIR